MRVQGTREEGVTRKGSGLAFEHAALVWCCDPDLRSLVQAQNPTVAAASAAPGLGHATCHRRPAYLPNQNRILDNIPMIG
jgi:hypothetical protein